MNVPQIRGSGAVPRLGALLLMALLLPCARASAAETESDAHAAARAAAQRPVAKHRPVIGVASVYAKRLDGEKTASGEVHDSDDLVAAHRTLPLGSEVRVTNLTNRRSVVVRINDRGPALKSRIIDLSPRAAAAIGLQARGKGITRVRLDVLRDGDRPVLAATDDAGKEPIKGVAATVPEATRSR